MLKLIIGPSGSGKTAHITECIRQDIQNKQPCLLLLPEQQGYIGERDLPQKLPKNAGLYFEVVNFSRLAQKVFSVYGGIHTPSVNPGIRAILMWNTLRTLSPMLKQYGSTTKGDITLSGMMLTGINELRAGGIDSQALEEAAAKLPEEAPLRKKLLDLALIEAAFRNNIEEAFGSDPGDALLRMREQLETHDFFNGTHIYIDSFTDFTVPEYRILEAMLRQAKQVTVTLCYDGTRSEMTHFEALRETAMRLEKAANLANVPMEKTVLPPRTEGKAPALAMLERELWHFTYQKKKDNPRPDTSPLRLISASHIYEEAEAAALQISEWVMDGMRYSDIAVVVRDTETYRGILDAAFERHGIPYFLSERTDLSSKSVSRLLLSALRAVSRNYRQEDIITLIKTGLCGVTLADAAMFEEYCETWHIGGTRFLEDTWSMNPDGLTTDRSTRAVRILEAANRVRRTVMEPLRTLQTELRTSSRLFDLCRALYHYCMRIHLSERLAEHAKQELESGQARAAGESIRLYRLIIDILSELCRLLPEETMTTDELINALTLLFSNSDLGSVPQMHDCVTVGSASTLRVENIRASLLLGLCEGEFPRSLQDVGILTESDKETLEGLGLVLASRENRRSSEELFYVYRAMTKPTEKLSLFTVAKQPDGSLRTPSLAFSRVQFLFDLPTEQFDIEKLQAAESIITPLHFTPALKTLPVTSPTTLRLSQSKIEAFVLCPYRYYSTYTLNLREVKDSNPSYNDDGIFLHYIFERFLRASVTNDGLLRLPLAEELERIADEIIEAYIRDVCPFAPGEINTGLLHLYARLRKLAITTLGDITAELSAVSFVPARFEQIIGMPGEDGLPPITIDLENGSQVRLSGKIDRVDFYKTEDKTYIRVVDYKSGKHVFSADKVRSGLDIQLVLYLAAACGAVENAVPAGAQYLYCVKGKQGALEVGRNGFCLDTEEILSASDGTFTGRYTKMLSKQTADEITALEAEMKTVIADVAKRILSGEAQKTPSEDACRYCAVRAHCDKAYHK